ncbi:MAG TPA: ATP-binding cassette domain-containing protein, partial [Pseudohaliea sp.]|nr:ATP-binding cassette domain-containing protein [Pseudohaliea sp.]
PAGELTNTVSMETQRVTAAFLAGINAVTFLLQALVYAAVALAISWQATLVGLAAGAVVIALCGLLVGAARRAGNRQTDAMRGLARQLADILLSARPLKAMGREALVEATLVTENQRLDRALRRQVVSAAALTAGQEELFTLVIVAGLYLALAPLQMPLPTVLVLVLVLGRMLAQLGKVQKEYQKVAIGESAYLACRETIARATSAAESGGTLPPPPLRRGITLAGVRFAYSAATVFDGLDLHIPAGAITTLMGPSGSGKSTLLDLVLGFATPVAGQVLVDGQPLAATELAAWRRQIGYVPQETHLLHDTVRQNVTLGDPGLTAGDAERALRAADAWELVTRLPGGLDHVVGERGGCLSGGQRQRILIARALAHRPRLLILDEATSALDDLSEAAICRTLRRLRGTLTILAVSHRPALGDIADHVHRLPAPDPVPLTAIKVATDCSPDRLANPVP